MEKTNAREGFASRLGFILVSAGCAIGIGNVWKFPYVTGENGGAFFVILYLIFLVIMGLPILTMEFAIGRAGKSTCVQAYKNLEPKGSKWHIHGWFCLAGCYLLMMYYTTVSGWMLAYFWKFASGQFNPAVSADVGEVFNELLSDPVEMTVFMVIIVICGFAVLCFGVQKGLERVTKIMMAGLLLLIIMLVINSVTLEGGAEGVKFYLLPDLDAVKNIGVFKVITSAMNQSFFTLSLGIGAMEIFGSYMSRDNTLTGESLRICLLDTFVALMAGLIIFPACSSYDVEPSQGPSLIFVTLPYIFVNMKGGMIWGALFFVFMTFASFSTITAVFENITVCLMDNFGWTRRKAILFNSVFILFAGMPCVLGFNVLSGFSLLGQNIMGIEDFVVSNLLLPVGSLIFLLFCVYSKGWGFDRFLAECNTGKGIKMASFLKSYYKFVLPVLIIIVLIIGLVPIS